MLEIKINEIKLLNFANLNSNQIKMIYEWRNSPKIAEFMINKSVAWEEHIAFITELKNQNNRQYFLVFKNAKPIGVISFINICVNSCEFGLYASPSVRGVGDLLMDTIIKYGFKELKVKEILARAFIGNTKAIRLYEKFGFKIVKKDDDMVYFGLRGE